MTQNVSTSKKGRILSRTFMNVDFVLRSPLCISGDGEKTDNDVMRDGSGNPFIPGSSLAGALRDYMTSRFSQGEANLLFGSIADEARQSPLIVSDGIIAAPIISVRDGVALDDGKQTIENAKYDMEIVEYGAKGSLNLELVLRDNHGFDLEKAKVWISALLIALDKNDIQLGMKKTRGFGLIQMTKLSMRHFDFDKKQSSLDESQAESYLEFLNNGFMMNLDELKGDGITAAELEALNNWKGALEAEAKDFKSMYDEIVVPLRLEGGLSIRQYSAQPEAPDFQHIQSRNVSVVPGTSWTGALRHRMKRILQELGVDAEKSEDEMNLIFGTLSSEEQPGFASPVRIYESRRDNAELSASKEKLILSTRTKINRFTGGAQDKALFTERMSVGGEYCLVIRMRKSFTFPKASDDEREKTTANLLKGHKGLFYLAIKDLCNGFLQVGGQTSIGRGLFSYAGENAEAVFSPQDEKECLKALAERVQELRKPIMSN